MLEKHSEISKLWRPKFHLAAVRGYMNDPVGLCEYKNRYHIFFQYSPLKANPGLNFWGHFSTEDFLNYIYHAPALCPDETFDCHGVYSGSAIAEDKLYLFYTGNVLHLGEHDYIVSGREHNQIIANSEDGVEFTGKTLLLINEDYPDNMSCHVRDPKVIKTDNGYLMLLGARTKDNRGCILVYSSKDKFTWIYTKTITSKEDYGYMWECPDSFNLNGNQIIIFCPQGIPSKPKHANTYQSVYTVCDDIMTADNLEAFHYLDFGFDFYAPQTFCDNKGRRILIGWMGLSDSGYDNPTEEFGWQHHLTIPRELDFKDGRLLQRPVSELESLRRDEHKVKFENETQIEDLTVFESQISDFKGELEFTVRESLLGSYNGEIFTVSFADNGAGRTKREAKVGKIECIRIFCDESSVEIFLDDKAVFSSRYFPRDNQRGIKIKAQSGKVRAWDLDSIKIELEDE